jgi:pimeloyl-ACP methyl ester carboxylesterase
VLVGRGLGANLALETAAAHPELTGVVAEDPIGSPEQVIFGDPRARLVPAHWLVSDRWDVAAAAKGLRIPSLWFFSASPAKAQSTSANAYDAAQGRKLRVWLTDSPARSTDYETGLSRWLGDLSAAQKTP